MDRGAWGLEVLVVLAAWKLALPAAVTLLRCCAQEQQDLGVDSTNTYCTLLRHFRFTLSVYHCEEMK